MKNLRFGKCAAAIGLAVLALCCLTCCTAQSTPLGERAVVRLIWLEKAGERYNALTMVCDFTGDDKEQKVLVQTAQGDTAEQALQQAAGQRGDEPFFAQNRLLLLGPQLAAAELPQVLNTFAANCGAYRDPALWLWCGGQEALLALQDPMAFVQMAEKLTQEDTLGCTVHVLECAGSDAAVLPVLEPAEGENAGVRVGGLALPQDGFLRLYREEDILQGYGMLRGRQKEQLLTVEHTGARYTLLLEELHRDLFVRKGKLCLTLRGACVPAAEAPGAAASGLQETAAQIVHRQCTTAWRVLTQNGQQDIFALRWWARQLGASENSAAAPVLDVSLHLE